MSWASSHSPVSGSGGVPSRSARDRTKPPEWGGRLSNLSVPLGPAGSPPLRRPITPDHRHRGHGTRGHHRGRPVAGPDRLVAPARVHWGRRPDHRHRAAELGGTATRTAAVAATRSATRTTAALTATLELGRRRDRVD